MHDPNDSHRQLAEAIRRYLAAHPDAADSAQGIADWWLNEPAPVDAVLDALESLVREGLVERRVLTGGRVIYKAIHPPGNKLN